MSVCSLIQPADLPDAASCVVFDCRFSLADPEQGRRDYLAGHVPGAHHLDLNLYSGHGPTDGKLIISVAFGERKVEGVLEVG